MVMKMDALFLAQYSSRMLSSWSSKSASSPMMARPSASFGMSLLAEIWKGRSWMFWLSSRLLNVVQAGEPSPRSSISLLSTMK